MADTYLSNAVLASKVDTLVQRWSVREDQYRAWSSGAANGGPNGDGRFPITDEDGNTHLLESPAKLTELVNDPAGKVQETYAATLLAKQAVDAAAAKTDAQSSKALEAREAADVASMAAKGYRDDTAADKNAVKAFRDEVEDIIGDFPTAMESVRDRSTHSGTQSIDTITDLRTTLARSLLAVEGMVFPEEYGFDPSGTLSAQNAAIQRWAAAGRSGHKLGLGPKVYPFTSPIDLTGVSNLKIAGAGSELSALRYKGPTGSENLVTVGGTGPNATVVGCEARGFQIQSDTWRSGGSALMWQHVVAGSVLEDVSPDKRSYRMESVDTMYKLFHGVSFLNTNVTDYIDFLIGYMQGDGVRVYGVADADTASDILLDRGTIVGCAGAGVHLGGGFGGLQVGEVLMFGNLYNARITNELCARWNREVFFRSDSVFDGAYIYNLEINDPRSGGSSIAVESFLGSAGLVPGTGVPRPEAAYVGDNIHCVAWNGALTVTSKKVFNAKRHGLAVYTPHVQVYTPDPVAFQTNGRGGFGYGIYYENPDNPSEVAKSIFCSARWGRYDPDPNMDLSNKSGNFNSLSGIGDWADTVPINIQSGSGRIEGYTAFCRHTTIGHRTEMFNVSIHITDNGDGGNNLAVYLPFSAAFKSVAHGIAEDGYFGVVGLTLNDAGAPNVLNVVRAAGGYPGSSGQKITISGTIERAHA